jgi:signal transduction histidine kinase
MISIYLSIKTDEYNLVIEDSKITRDELREDTLSLRRYNEQLRIDKEKNIQIAILTERNRIARELHDSIGHAISSSILQVEALKIVSDKNQKSLSVLQNTLQNGMNDIRKSIHNLYNESFDLKAKIQNLCDEIQSIDFKFNYRIDSEMDYDLKYDIFSVVREAVTNSVKHSNANEVNISILNQVKFYSILIEDNGTLFDKDIDALNKGIGLISMKEIANKYNGFLKYEYDNGFKIRLVLMKGDAK